MRGRPATTLCRAMRRKARGEWHWQHSDHIVVSWLNITHYDNFHSAQPQDVHHLANRRRGDGQSHTHVDPPSGENSRTARSVFVSFVLIKSTSDVIFIRTISLHSRPSLTASPARTALQFRIEQPLCVSSFPHLLIFGGRLCGFPRTM